MKNKVILPSSKMQVISSIEVVSILSSTKLKTVLPFIQSTNIY